VAMGPAARRQENRRDVTLHLTRVKERFIGGTSGAHGKKRSTWLLRGKLQ